MVTSIDNCSILLPSDWKLIANAAISGYVAVKCILVQNVTENHATIFKDGGSNHKVV